MRGDFSYRPALDGLRAVAVLAVIGYHIDFWLLPGGFLGVDLFFVLSGYLITSLLLIESAASGTVHLGRFWTRRIRRLLPASLIVLATVVAFTAAFGDVLDQTARRPEVLSALAYVVNWDFIVSGTSYFQSFASASPIRHYWSLAIEEQFYLLWPLALFALVRFGRRKWIGPIAAIAALGSALLMIALFDPSQASRSYFGTDTRIHQILIGCLLAVYLQARPAERLLRGSRLQMPLILGALLAAFVMLEDSSSLYYQGGSLAFAVVVALAIVGLESSSSIRNALSLGPLVWIGKISYGLYLWHWPVILWLRPGSTGLNGATLQGARILLTFAVATVSYYLVERPIRRGHLGRFTVDRHTLKVQVPVATGTLATVILLALTPQIPDWMRQPATATREPVAPESTSSPTTGATNGQSIVGVVGDSVMVSMLPAIRSLSSQNGWYLVEGAIQACPVGYEPLYGYDGALSPYYETICREGVPAAHRRVRDAEPRAILWHDLQSTLPRMAGNTLLDPGTRPWVDDLVQEWETVIDSLGASVEDIVIIYPPLRSQDQPGCAGSVREPRCQTIQRQDSDIRLAVDALGTQHSGKPEVHLIKLDPELCPRGYPCPARIDGIEVRFGGNDQTHFTEVGSLWLEDALRAAIRRSVPSLVSGTPNGKG